METGNVVLGDRAAFMQHAYTALYTGRVYELSETAQRAVVAEVSRDLFGLIRTLAPSPTESVRACEEFREELIAATRGSH